MKRFLILFATLVVLLGETKAADKPNVIFILADDLGYGDLGVTGSRQIPTPHIDSTQLRSPVTSQRCQTPAAK